MTSSARSTKQLERDIPAAFQRRNYTIISFILINRNFRFIIIILR